MAREKLIPEHEIPDNDEQLRMLEEMVRDQHEARVYLIRDAREGCGKTLLLRKLHWACQSLGGPDCRLVTGLIDLEDHTDPTPYSLIRTIAEKLELSLPNYDYLQLALDTRNPFPFMASMVARGVDLRDATVTGHAQVAGIIVQPGAQLHIPETAVQQWHDDLRPRAERLIINAFFDDLRALPDDVRVAIFIDSVDVKATSPELRRWVVETLLEKVFLDVTKRPKGVLLCVAGRDLADYTKRLPDAEQKVLSPGLLTTWKEEHTEAFFRFMLTRPLNAIMLNAIHNEIVTNSLPLARAYTVARLMVDPTDG